MRRILFVDDEPRILMALRRMLHGLRAEWEMVFAEGGAEALQCCAADPFDVVVSDARMPGIDGAGLLREVMRLAPDTVRVILSGQCSRDAVLQCAGVAHQFLSKPCNAEALKAAVQRVCAVRERFGAGPTRPIVSRAQTLPSQPDVYAELVSLASRGASIGQVADAVARDVALCAKTVQLVSSGFFGTPQRVADTGHAARLLGLETVKALLDSGLAFVPGDPALHSTAALRRLSAHSAAVAAAAGRIARTVSDDPRLAGDAELAGMLHHVGDLALGPLPGGDLQPLGPDAGAYLAALWGLPDPIVHAVGHYRAPGRSWQPGFGPLAALHVAHALLEPHDEPRHDPTALDTDYLTRTGCRDRLALWRQTCAACREGAPA